MYANVYMHVFTPLTLMYLCIYVTKLRCNLLLNNECISLIGLRYLPYLCQGEIVLVKKLRSESNEK